MTITGARAATRRIRRLPWHELWGWLPLALAVVQVVGTFGASRGQPDRTSLDPLGVALLLAGPAALVFSRIRPVVTLCTVMAVTLTYLLLGYPYGPVVLSPVVAVFCAIRRGHRLATWLAAGALYTVHLVVGPLVGARPAASLAEAGFVAGWFLAMLIGAELARIRHERVEASRRAAAAEAAGRVSEERLRLARDLHDVVAHNISLINVQAGVALHLMDAQPEQARTALTAIKQASKEALVELRSVLGVLRAVDGDEASLKPTPGLHRLDELADRARQAGLDVAIDVSGTRRSVPSAVDVAAYRIIQEALTNVLRHARATAVRIHLSYDPQRLRLQVVDNGVGNTKTSAHPEALAERPDDGSQARLRGAGAGIAGMRERASVLGGELHAGPLPEGGFSVKATLPLVSDDHPEVRADGRVAGEGT
ncbi:MAG TPA: sensor histidine kinase [Actinopolymorphaceae bacterium]